MITTKLINTLAQSCILVLIISLTSCTKQIFQEVDLMKFELEEEINVLDFRDSSSNDHDMIQMAIDYAKNRGVYNVYIPDGTYMISATASTGQSGLLLRDSINLRLDSNAILQCIPNANGNYGIVKIQNVSHVNIRGGKIVGDRSAHLGTSGEWGMGIDIRNSSDIRVSNITIKDCWGDGIYIASGSTLLEFDSVITDNNRRQGMSVINCKDLLITNSAFNNTNGKAPQSGIDLEPNAGDSINNVQILNCYFNNNAGLGLHMYGNFGPITNVLVDNCTMTSNPIGLSLRYAGVNTVTISDVLISKSSTEGFRVFDGAHHITVSNVKVFKSTLNAIRFQDSPHVEMIGGEVDSFAVGLKIVNADQLIVKNTSLISKNSNANGIEISNSDTVLFDNIELVGGKDGLRTASVSNMRFINSSISGFLEYGCYLGTTLYSLFENNTISGNRKTPFYLTSSHDNQFKNNELLDNGFLVHNNYSQFNLEGASKRNLFQYNVARASIHTNKPKYVIRLSTSTSGNQVIGNTFEIGSYVLVGAVDETGGLNTIL